MLQPGTTSTTGVWGILLATLCFCGAGITAQTLDISSGTHTFAALTNTTLSRRERFMLPKKNRAFVDLDLQRIARFQLGLIAQLCRYLDVAIWP